MNIKITIFLTVVAFAGYLYFFNPPSLSNREYEEISNNCSLQYKNKEDIYNCSMAKSGEINNGRYSRQKIAFPFIFLPLVAYIGSKLLKPKDEKKSK